MSKNRDRIIVAVIVASVLALFFIISIVMLLVPGRTGQLGIEALGGKVALVDIKGIVDDSEDVVRQIRKYQDDNSVKALVLRLDTPGGGVAASQEIYSQLLKFKEEGKYVVASMGSVAASGGYYIACAADTIFANPGTLTGSIGVILSFPVFEKLMDKIGIKMEVVKAGDLKDVGNFSRQMSDDERAMLQALIDDAHSQFIEVVSEARGIGGDSIRNLADGSVFTGRQAFDLGLVDRLGSFRDAVSAAGNMADLGDDPRTIKERPYRRRFWEPLVELLGINLKLVDAGRAWPMLEYRYGL